MSRFFRILFISGIVAFASCAGAQKSREGSRETLSLATVKNADASRDAAAAIARKDRRFWAVNGFTSGMIPGIDQYGADSRWVKICGFRTIVGTSDTDPKLNKIAHEYARTYNQILLRWLRAEAYEN